MIIDYLWGPPTETLLSASQAQNLRSRDRRLEGRRERGTDNHTAAAVLRSTALTILGTAGIRPWDLLTEAFQQVMNHAASDKLRIETERVPLAVIEDAWERNVQARRLVVIP